MNEEVRRRQRLPSRKTIGRGSPAHFKISEKSAEGKTHPFPVLSRLSIEKGKRPTGLRPAPLLTPSLLSRQGIECGGLRHTLAWSGERRSSEGRGPKESPRWEALPYLINYTMPRPGNRHESPRKSIKSKNPGKKGLGPSRASQLGPSNPLPQREASCLFSNRPSYAPFCGGRSEPITRVVNWYYFGATPAAGGCPREYICV